MILSNKMFLLCNGIETILQQLRSQGFASPCFDQVKRSSTSIGANWFEAKGCYTDKDFRKTIAVSLKEVNETIWWIEILNKDYNLKSNYVKIKNLAYEIKEEIQEVFLESYQNGTIPTDFGEMLRSVDNG